MEDVFLRFDSYDFEVDPRFQDGLNRSSCSRDETKLLDMKLFYYNRFVEPIDQTKYKQWSSSSPHVKTVDCCLEQLDRRTDSEIRKSQTAETEATQLSFVEVMRLVQEGKEVPGAIKLDIKPSNQSPTPSQMERMLKPWETASSSSK
ncbi:putative protein C6orf226 -like protein [Channa argus]|uniref:Uncharacterized protein n=1 Tax=Channa argus TaxID=215402 RepID=A0A6G1Q3U8_CHAAH|nr:putative protein C6orf226 -like protein [Channa argus]KAK2897301.1 hypothetical protein Q8A73_013681 [Channa argus]